MEKNKTIPGDYMTVGEVAKKMNVTVRTLQYYDKEGLLSPTSESEGGRRLYTHKDLVKLHQILSMKHLGFSLYDIKNRLISLETPSEVANALTMQAETIREKIDNLSESLRDIEALKEEVLQMKQVDFKKYADIIANLQMNNHFYWLIKHLDEETLNHYRNHFDMDSGLAVLDSFTSLFEEAILLQEKAVPPESETGIAFAEAFWDMISEFTGGDMSMLPKLMEMATIAKSDNRWKEQQEAAFAFIEPALDAYFSQMNYNPFQGVEQ